MASSYKPHAAPKRRALVASNIGALPLDPLYEILLRLPAKLLCRLRTVCRLWWSILSDPQLAAVHATRHPGPLIIAALDEEHDVLVNIMDLSGQILKQVRGVPGQRVVSTALDLVCLKKIDSINSRYRCWNRFFWRRALHTRSIAQPSNWICVSNTRRLCRRTWGCRIVLAFRDQISVWSG